ncbi:MAG: succinyl-diaminopimelate desuccinylase, partial [Acidobacteriota bacterium]
MALHPSVIETIAAAADQHAEEIVAFAAELIRIPTVNPPGEEYETCARFIGDRLRACDFDVHYVAAEGRP